MKKNGFIATSLIYSFFLIFITLFLSVIADYLQQKVLLNTIETGIKQDINNSLGIQDFRIGDVITFDKNFPNNNLKEKQCTINNITYRIKNEDTGVYTGTDSLELQCNEESSTISLVMNDKRLAKVSSSETFDGSITITGWV